MKRFQILELAGKTLILLAIFIQLLPLAAFTTLDSQATSVNRIAEIAKIELNHLDVMLNLQNLRIAVLDHPAHEVSKEINEASKKIGETRDQLSKTFVKLERAYFKLKRIEYILSWVFSVFFVLGSGTLLYARVLQIRHESG